MQTIRKGQSCVDWAPRHLQTMARSKVSKALGVHRKPAILCIRESAHRSASPTSASGVLMEIDGKPVALVGDACSCPIPGHGSPTITEGDPDYLINGKPVAYEGCKTSCGATLISCSQQLASTSPKGGGAPALAAAAQAAVKAAAKLEAAKHAMSLEENSKSEPTLPSGALVIYGRGGKLGNLKGYADTQKKELLDRFEEKDIQMNNVIRRETFLSELEKFGETHKIKELHIFSHAYGCGLSFGYEDHALETMRTKVWDKFKPRVPYIEVLNAESGILFTDNLVMNPYKDKRDRIRSLFDGGALIKIWGCNSGVPNYIFKDFVNGVMTSDPTVGGAYYWRALNEHHSPKSSIAKSLADYLGVSVWASTSGSHIEVMHEGRWITSDDYKQMTGHWATDSIPSRLAPDRGNYKEFK